MFVPGKPFQPSLMFGQGQESTLKGIVAPLGYFRGVGSCLALNYYTRLERLVRNFISTYTRNNKARVFVLGKLGVIFPGAAKAGSGLTRKK